MQRRAARRPTHRARPIDPRVTRSRQVILEAALTELGEIGYGAFTIESVAARAGVGKSTIYRHWRDKLTLIADAFQTLHEQRGPDIANGSVRERLTRIVRHVADVVAGSTFSACIPALIDGAERDREVRRFHHRFQEEARKPLVAVLAEGVAVGELASHLDPEFTALAILGVVFYRRLMTRVPFDPEEAEGLLATVLGLGPGLRA
jgi:AcrR family transcriptional regulator